MLELLVELTKYAGQTNKQTNPILSHDIPFLEDKSGYYYFENMSTSTSLVCVKMLCDLLQMSCIQ